MQEPHLWALEISISLLVTGLCVFLPESGEQSALWLCRAHQLGNLGLS